MFETEEAIKRALYRDWIWVSDWDDAPPVNSAGRLVTFSRVFEIKTVPSTAVVHCTADTKYKLIINGKRVGLGPARSSPERWSYDTHDISPHLRAGKNEIKFLVMRYFLGVRGGMPFVRTAFPGLSVVSSLEDVDISTGNLESWTAEILANVEFPTGLIDDWCLHINERIKPIAPVPATPKSFKVTLLNGDLPPWRLQPRIVPFAEQTPVSLALIGKFESVSTVESWSSLLKESQVVTLGPKTSHLIDLQAECHSTAFIRFAFRSTQSSTVTLKLTYSEGYELEPRQYPFFRTKADRKDSINGQILGPFDHVVLNVGPGETVYEPFWFRTFWLIRMEIEVGDAEIEVLSIGATQTNYPMDVKATWNEPSDPYAAKIFDISVRTLRNCMFDGYSDCPFYEQLQYSGDGRSAALFHYLLSGDDRLARDNIICFAGSVTPEGLTQSRYPSQVKQLIAGFPLYWTLQICDHMLYFGDAKFARSFLPLIDGVLEFFHRHIDDLGLVSGLPRDLWQYVDWVEGWHATDEHPDKGVPTAGRKTNRHTYFSMLYAYVLKQVAILVRRVGRPQYGEEYESRAEQVILAIRKHCFSDDLQIFTDSTSDVAPVTPAPHSQHAQVFAVLSGACVSSDAPRLLLKAFSADSKLGKCSYVMMFYAFRAFSQAGVYNQLFYPSMEPWRRMVRQNMSTWEEDDVRQRSDCHAWGSVPLHEYYVELAGIQPTAPGCQSILFAPRIELVDELNAKVALGKDNTGTVSWSAKDGVYQVELILDIATEIVSRLPDKDAVNHGRVKSVQLVYKSP